MNTLLSIPAQLERISKYLPCILFAPLSVQEKNAIPYLRFIKDNPSCTSKRLARSLQITGNMARHRLLFLNEEGYIDSDSDSDKRSGTTLYWHITPHGKQFLIRYDR